jgi:hypothetical protein
MKSVIVVLALATTTAHAGDVISPPYRGPRLGNVQCLIRNNSTRNIYAIPEWIECTGKGTVANYGGKELVPGENYNLVTTDRRACRCRVTFDGKAGEIQIFLASGTAGPQAAAADGKMRCCRAGQRGCNWLSAVGCP